MYIITYTKKLLNSDWLRAVQFRCNTSAKSVTPNDDEICAEILKKLFSNEKKMSSSTFSTKLSFKFILLISNHTVFLVQFGINLHL